MNIVNKLTFRHLKENKGRTIVTTLGICVSVAMITAVFVSVASFMKFFGDVTVFESGNKHVEYYNLSNEQIEELKADDRIDEIGLYAELPEESDAFMVDSDSTHGVRVGNIYAADETNLKQMLTGRLDGELPKNEHEIAVEQSLIEKNNLKWKIGDTVTVTLGERYHYSYDYSQIEDFNEESEVPMVKEHMAGSWNVSDEQFEPAYDAQFKIVGVLYDNKPTKRYGKIVRGMSSEEKKSLTNAAVTLKNPNYKSLDVIEDISKSIGVDTNYIYGDLYMKINKDYLQSKLAIDRESILATTIMPMGIVVLIIIMIASVVLIYNSFGMSLSERTRYLGMLGSVGATKRQKKQSVYFEGAALGLVGIPLGIIGGVIGIGVTLEIVGKKIVETGMLMGVDDSNIKFQAVVPLWAVVGVVIFSLITIFISAVIPAKKASSITPVEALRQSNEIKLKAKKVKSPKYIRKIFGYEGELAHKNLKRNGRKSRVITASIAISVILFLSVNYFCSMFTRVNSQMDVPYQIEINCTIEDMEKIKTAVLDFEKVEDAYALSNSMLYMGKNYPVDYDNALGTNETLTNAYKDLWNSNKTINIFSIEDELFNKICSDNGVDYKPYYDIENCSQKMLLLNNLSRKEGGSGVFNDKAIGSKLHSISTDDENGNKIDYYYQVQNLIDYKSDNKFFSLSPKNYFIAFVPNSASVEMNSQIFKSDSIVWTELCVETSEHKDTAEKISKYVDENAINANIFDVAENMESINTILFVLQVFIYGFITLITMITIANIINTISTSIALRRKEFAMLKSVGATQKGFYKMVCLESLFYGLNALIVSIPLSLLISLGFNKIVGRGDVPFEIDFLLYACVIFAVFLIIGFSMLYSVKKIKKDSIIETLKQDIT